MNSLFRPNRSFRMVFWWQYFLMPSAPWRRPRPLSFIPPMGASGITKFTKLSLMHTEPPRIFSATSQPFLPSRVNPVTRTYVRGFRACPSGTSEHSSLHLRTGRSVVRGKYAAAESIARVVGEPQCLIKVLDFHDRNHGTKSLLSHDLHSEFS